MPYIKVGQENSGSIDLYYEDHGSGRPVVLIHGYPVSGRAWDRQIPVLLEHGHRVITYDRRGFGKSSQPTTGYDYDTFANDLHTLLHTLGLRDVTLVGHSMGTGEVTRYLGRFGSAGRFGSERVARGVLVSPIPPFLLQTPDNPEGVPASLFEGFMQAAKQDIPTWETDFRADLPKIDVPMLVIHGDDDNVLPYAKTGARLAGLISNVQTVVITGGPHAIAWTHADQVNDALLKFMA